MTGLKSLDDKALITMTLAGQRGCFDVLMDRHLGTAVKCVHAMIPNRAEAEDVLQNVQLKTWIHLSLYRGESSLRTWITRIAVNESLLSIRRARSTRQYQYVNLDDLAASKESPFSSYARQEAAGMVRAAIERLPANFREILILRDLRELTTEETARCLNSSPQAVKSRLFRARTMLSKALSRHRKRPVRTCRVELAA
jgi:RNA polymerase sigma-70 factor (ECF subfamily)